MFPAEPRLAKVVNEATSLRGNRFAPHKEGPGMHGDVHGFHINIPKDSVIMVDIMGVHYNRKIVSRFLFSKQALRTR
jgi:hypothetical protein